MAGLAIVIGVSGNVLAGICLAFFMPLALLPPQPSLPAALLRLKAELIRYGFYGTT